MINGHPTPPPAPKAKRRSKAIAGVGPEHRPPEDYQTIDVKVPAPELLVGTWLALCDHLTSQVPVPGIARENGYGARLKGAELLGVRPEWVRVEWRTE